ncbi:MAG: hypothetical protein FWD62_13035 [Betaproteobacteria bacterium]|nr:hypothetical protein [Betaproteobacteria bacterium]
MSSWSCPHDLNNVCQRVQGARCDPGMRGCVLEGRVRFAREESNVPRKPIRAEPVQKDEEKLLSTRRRLPF